MADGRPSLDDALGFRVDDGVGATDERVSVVMLLDTSQSMGNGEPPARPIDSLNDALRLWGPELARHPELRRSGEIAIITFGHGGVQLHNLQGTGAPASFRNAFVPAGSFQPPVLHASGVTPMLDAIRLAVPLVNDRKDHLRQQGVQIRFRPLIWMISDGAPTDAEGNRSRDWRSIIPTLREGEAERRFLFFAIGVGAGANEEVLRGLAPASTYLYDQGAPFIQLLKLVSTSSEAGLRSGRRGREAEASQIYENVRNRQKTLEELFAPKV